MSDTVKKATIVAGLTAKEIIMLAAALIPLYSAGLYFVATLDHRIDLLAQVQDTTQKAVSAHATTSGHPGTQNHLAKIDTKQAVMESTLKNIDDKIEEQGATLHDINRSLQNLSREQ